MEEEISNMESAPKMENRLRRTDQKLLPTNYYIIIYTLSPTSYQYMCITTKS